MHRWMSHDCSTVSISHFDESNINLSTCQQPMNELSVLSRNLLIRSRTFYCSEKLFFEYKISGFTTWKQKKNQQQNVTSRRDQT